MRKFLLVLVVLLMSCGTWVHPDPLRHLSRDKAECSREVRSYLPFPTLLEYPVIQDLQIARAAWKYEFDKLVRACLRDRGWEKK